MYKVMIVDDKEVFRRKLKRLHYFRDESSFAITEEAENGEQALERLNQEPVDVIITDIRMPKIDGIELLKIAKKRQLCKCVILLSEYSDFSYAKEGLVYGAFDYILKPVDEEKISQVMARVSRFLDDEKRELVLIKAEDMLFSAIMNNDKNIKEIGQRLVRQISENEFMEKREKIVFIKSLLEQLYYEELDKHNEIMQYEPIKDMCFLDYVMEDRYSLLTDYFVYIIEEIEYKVHRFDIETENQTINQIKEYILINVENDISLKKIADEFFINSKYLSTLFKKCTGKSYVEYVTNIKVARALFLFETTQLKNYEIAQKLGYDDAEYFSKIVKKVTGFTPNELKKGKQEWKRKKEEIFAG